MALLFKVIGQKLRPETKPFLASGTLNYPEIKFEFDEEWTGFSKTATFSISNSDLYYMEVSNDSCMIPAEVMVADEIISIGLYGTKGTTRITTNIVDIPCYKSGYGLGISPPEHTVDIITQLRQVVDKLQAECNLMSKKITQYIINGINALHPEYTITTFSETIDTESDVTMTCTVDLNVYNPDKSDGLLVTADGVLVSPLGYATSVEDNAAKIQFFESAGLQVGQTVNFTVYHKPQGGGLSAGQAVILATGTADSVAGIAQTMETEE